MVLSHHKGRSCTAFRLPIRVVVAILMPGTAAQHRSTAVSVSLQTKSACEPEILGTPRVKTAIFQVLIHLKCDKLHENQSHERTSVVQLSGS